MSVQIKAHLYEDTPCKSSEIRKFSIDHDVLTNYEYFRQKVASIFPSIRHNFTLQWKDSDGDLVWFDSDEELFQGLCQNNENEFKVFIKSEPANGNSLQWDPKFCNLSSSPFQIPFDFLKQNFLKGSKLPKEGPEQISATETGDASYQKGVYSEYLQQMQKTMSEFLRSFGVDADVNATEYNKSFGTTTSEIKTNFQPPSSTEQLSPSTSNEPPSSNAEDKVEVDEAALQEVLNRLLGMGFNNQGGWLTNLLKATDCDLERALDAIERDCTGKN